MKKKVLTLLMAVFMISVLTACGGSSNADTNSGVEADTSTVEETPTPTETEAPHEHAYAEEITTPATCEADGLKTFTCECEDTYAEVITATGHTFEAYTSNNDASYTADGTETSKCSNCDVTDTRTAEGSMLTYTYTDMDATMYVQKSVNVRSLPSTDGEKLGGLNTNDEVKVTGQCAETSWYRFEYNGNVAYVSNSYLGTDKVVVQQPSTPTEPSQPSDNDECPYALYTLFYDNMGYPYYYGKEGGDVNMDADNLAKTNAMNSQIQSIMGGNYALLWKNAGTYNGISIVVRYISYVGPMDGTGTRLPEPEARGISY